MAGRGQGLAFELSGESWNVRVPTLTNLCPGTGRRPAPDRKTQIALPAYHPDRYIPLSNYRPRAREAVDNDSERGTVTLCRHGSSVDLAQ